MRMANVTFEKLCKKTAKHIRKNGYDKVILTQFEYTRLSEHYEYSPLIGKVTDQHEYGYGWELESFDFENIDSAQEKIDSGEIVEDNHGQKIVQGGNHSNVVLVDDWIESLRGHDVYLCGAFDGECIEDMEIALSAVNVNYKRVSKLII